MRRRTVSLAIGCAVVAYVTQGHGASVEEYVAQVAENTSSIVSLDCTFRLRFGENAPETRWRFARQGEMWHRSEISHDSERDAERTAGICYDGEYVYTLLKRRFDDGTVEWRQIDLRDGDAVPPTHLFPDALIGARLSNLGCSIDEVWEVVRPECTVDATGRVMLVARSYTSQHEDTFGIAFDVEYVADPSHSLLPTSINITASGQNPLEWFQKWEIDKWQNVTDAASGSTRWFPSRGVLRQPGEAPTIVLTVDAVSLNTKLPNRLFRPEDAPDGTAIVNGTSEGEFGAIAIVGSDKPLDSLIAQVVSDTNRLSRRRPATITWLSLGSVTVALLLVVVVVVVRRRQARRTT